VGGKFLMHFEYVTIEQGLDFMLSHFSEPIWPRNIATAATQTKQYTVDDRQRALLYFNSALRQDCRLAIYANYEELIKTGRLGPNWKPIPNHLFIELDAKDFGGNLGQLNAALKSTLRRIKKQLNHAVPTVLWSGGGYHIHQPLDITEPFENLEEFKKYGENVNVKFLRYAARQLSAGKSDPNHNVSFKSCLCRVPGSINSKYQGEVAEVRILQRWNGIRAKPNRQFITDFLIALTQKDIDQSLKNYKIIKIHNATNYKNIKNGKTQWIETLLQLQLSDYRRNARDLILVPYLTLRRGLSPNEVYDIVMSWADRCVELRPLQPSRSAYESRVHTRIQEVMRDKVPAMTLEKLREMNPELFKILSSKGINRSQYHYDYMQSINTNGNETIENNNYNKKLLSQKALENLRKNKEQKARDSKYISWEDGEEKELQFDAEKIRQVPSKFGDDNKRYEYTVVDLRNFPDMDKLWTVGKKTSDMIDEKLAEGHSILLIECEGEGTSRKFKISPRE
jgi:hypothetical protein